MNGSTQIVGLRAFFRTSILGKLCFVQNIHIMHKLCMYDFVYENDQVVFLSI